MYTVVPASFVQIPYLDREFKMIDRSFTNIDRDLAFTDARMARYGQLNNMFTSSMAEMMEKAGLRPKLQNLVGVGEAME